MTNDNQPSAPSMSLEEARKLLNNTDKEFQEIWETQERIAEKMIRSMELIDAVKNAASLLAASEQREKFSKILKKYTCKSSNGSHCCDNFNDYFDSQQNISNNQK